MHTIHWTRASHVARYDFSCFFFSFPLFYEGYAIERVDGGEPERTNVCVCALRVRVWISGVRF